MYSLIKFNNQDNIFVVSPNILRKTTNVNAFMSGLAILLDKNFALGNILLPIVLKLLRYLPQPSIDENVSIRVSQIQAENLSPNYTIGLLTCQARHAWINTLTIILYKYQYNNDTNNSQHIVKQLVRIVINTLKFQFHKCDITSFDPVNLDLTSKQLTSDSSQDSTINNSANVMIDRTQHSLLFSSIRNINPDDNMSVKSSEKSTKRFQVKENRKKIFKIK